MFRVVGCSPWTRYLRHIHFIATLCYVCRLLDPYYYYYFVIVPQYNVAAVMTNQMTSDPSGGMTFVADPKKPIGGHVLAHTVQTRLSLRKGSGEDRIAKLVDSTTMPMADATFTITEEGITDSK